MKVNVKVKKHFIDADDERWVIETTPVLIEAGNFPEPRFEVEVASENGGVDFAHYEIDMDHLAKLDELSSNEESNEFDACDFCNIWLDGVPYELISEVVA